MLGEFAQFVVALSAESSKARAKAGIIQYIVLETQKIISQSSAIYLFDLICKPDKKAIEKSSGGNIYVISKIVTIFNVYKEPRMGEGRG